MFALFSGVFANKCSCLSIFELCDARLYPTLHELYLCLNAGVTKCQDDNFTCVCVQGIDLTSDDSMGEHM